MCICLDVNLNQYQKEVSTAHRSEQDTPGAFQWVWVTPIDFLHIRYVWEEKVETPAPQGTHESFLAWNQGISKPLTGKYCLFKFQTEQKIEHSYPAI